MQSTPQRQDSLVAAALGDAHATGGSVILQADARRIPLATRLPLPLKDGGVQAVLLAYCAGVVDSDGMIGVKLSTYAMRVRQDSTQPHFSERIQVRQVEAAAIELLRSLFGGALWREKPSARNGKPLWCWQLSDLKAATCLDALLPYLRIKRKQAENCLRLRAIKTESKRARIAVGRGHQGSAVRPAALSAAMEACYAEAKALNAVGRREAGR